MELNDTHKMALAVSERIGESFADRAGSTEIYDVVHQPGHYAFKIKFLAFKYFVVVFQYELDIIGCSIECGTGDRISLVEGKRCYSDTDLNAYFAEVKNALELRIPDKFLAANGWLRKT